MLLADKMHLAEMSLADGWDGHAVQPAAAQPGNSTLKFLSVATHGDPIRLTEHATAALQATAQLGFGPDDADEEIARRDNEIRSLEASLELALGDNADLSERLANREAEASELRVELERAQACAAADKNAAVANIRADLDRATVALAEVTAERDTVKASLSTATEQRSIEANGLTTQLFAMHLRAVAAEKELADSDQRLRIVSEEAYRIKTNNEQLSRRVAEGVELLDRLSSQLRRAKSGLSSAEKKDATLSAELAQINHRHKVQIAALMARLASTSSRAAAAESKLLQARQSLSEKFTLLRRMLESRQVNQLTHRTSALEAIASSCDDAASAATPSIELPVSRVVLSGAAVTEISPSPATAMLLAATITF
jgi:chromosome segregation ATPase